MSRTPSKFPAIQEAIQRYVTKSKTEHQDSPSTVYVRNSPSVVLSPIAVAKEGDLEVAEEVSNVSVDLSSVIDKSAPFVVHETSESVASLDASNAIPESGDGLAPLLVDEETTPATEAKMMDDLIEGLELTQVQNQTRVLANKKTTKSAVSVEEAIAYWVQNKIDISTISGERANARAFVQRSVLEKYIKAMGLTVVSKAKEPTKSDLADTLHKFYNNNLTAIREAGGI